MVRCYLSGNPVHDRVIQAFYDGCPTEKTLAPVTQYEPSEIAVIFGVGKKKIPVSWPRGEIFRQQRSNNRDVIVLETGYVNRGDGETHHYAAGFNGLNGRADFRNKGMPDDRYLKLRDGASIPNWTVTMAPYMSRFDPAGHVLLCGQVPWDASVDHTDHVQWLQDTAVEIRKHTRRPVRFRPHPLGKIPPIEGCDYSTEPFFKDLARAHAVVTFNSNSGVEALISGVPVFAFDEGSMVWSVCNRELRDLDNPNQPSRQKWLNDLCYAQWTPAEMAEGRAWNHLCR